MAQCWHQRAPAGMDERGEAWGFMSTVLHIQPNSHDRHGRSGPHAITRASPFV